MLLKKFINKALLNLHFIFFYKYLVFFKLFTSIKASDRVIEGANWLSGRVPDSRPKGRGFEPHWRHCVVSLSKTHISFL